MSDVGFAWEILKTVEMMKDHGVKISFDPNVRLEMMRDRSVLDMLQDVFMRSSIFMPGASELRAFVGEEDLDRAIEKAFESPGLELLVLKDGARGSRVYGPKGLVVEQPAYEVVQVDPTGAGDCYDAAFICGLAEGKGPREAAQMGAAAGALAAAAFGPMEGDIRPETIRRTIDGR